MFVIAVTFEHVSPLVVMCRFPEIAWETFFRYVSEGKSVSCAYYTDDHMFPHRVGYTQRWGWERG